MSRSPAFLAVVLPALAGAAPGGCGGPTDIVDDWGPPAGYAVVAGAVTTAGGTPAAGAPVLLSRCAFPVGGYLGRANADGAGRYRLEGALPPVGTVPPLRLDTLRVRCAVFTDASGVARDSLLVRFRAGAAGPPLQRLDLRLP